MQNSSPIVAWYRDFLSRGTVREVSLDELATADSLAFVSSAYVGSALAEAAARFVDAPSMVTLTPLATITRPPSTPAFSKKRREFLTILLKELYEKINSR